MVIRVQNGDAHSQDYLLRMYQPFIAKSISEVCKRYIDPKTDDEFSIGLSAFNDAILSFSPDKGCSFLAFANIVIKRKIIDYIRSNAKYPLMMSLDEKLDNEQIESSTEIRISKERYQEKEYTIRLREEIMQYKVILSEYNLSLEMLTNVSPKHRDARDSAVRVARVLVEDGALRSHVVMKKKLPMKDLKHRVEVSKKTLERNRKYILAMFIVLNEEFIYLKDYLKGVGL
ncbi:RNA polymerase sigma-I factor [Oceanobacillus bengalensis]|uniref:RNA polymerase sigma factor SigI n=2 Tax=Oceanobacillus bengalensis TaxID=1435466 RepID=A0A494Z955_9BACI|nr:RNA polymerase sigma-I factor [Oceanobacillus bengalensis]